MKLDMHIHSVYSKDSKLSIERIIRAVKNKGLDGFALTDHNSYAGVKKAGILAKKNNLILIPGVEIKTEIGDVLVYNFNEPIYSRKFEDIWDKAKSQGAKIAIAHPFDVLRKRESVCDRGIIRNLKNKINFLEINGRSLPFFNKKVEKFALNFGFKLIAGSDAHFGFEIGKCFSVIDSIEKLKVKFIVSNASFNLLPLILTKLYKKIV